MTTPCLLAFDSATDRLYLGLCVGARQWLDERQGGRRASAVLIGRLTTMLAAAGIGLRQLDAIAFGRGPGAFTGLRAACAVAQGLAFGAHRPLLAVDTLMAVAEDARMRSDAADVWVAVDARMGEIYAAHYTHEASGWRTRVEPALHAPQELAALLAASATARRCRQRTLGLRRAVARLRFQACRRRQAGRSRLAGLRASGLALGGARTDRCVASLRAQPSGVDNGGTGSRPGAFDSNAMRRDVSFATRSCAPGNLVDMRIEDLDAVMAIERAVYGTPWTRGNFIDSLHAGCIAWCLSDAQSTLLGYIVAMQGAGEVHLLNLTVAPAAQRQGHARHMLERLVSACAPAAPDRYGSKCAKETSVRARCIAASALSRSACARPTIRPPPASTAARARTRSP